ncbi:hypothetical protein AC249_AIPGENE33, partial [Exaiptasia diaphana]
VPSCRYVPNPVSFLVVLAMARDQDQRRKQRCCCLEWFLILNQAGYCRLES